MEWRGCSSSSDKYLEPLVRLSPFLGQGYLKIGWVSPEHREAEK